VAQLNGTAAAIGPGLSLAQMPALARYIFERRVRGMARSLIRPDEYEALTSEGVSVPALRLFFGVGVCLKLLHMHACAWIKGLRRRRRV
jgi:hypothetical protein